MKPVFLGDTEPKIECWQERLEYWRKVVSRTRATGHRLETYKGVVLGLEMLLDGKAKYVGEGQISY